MNGLVWGLAAVAVVTLTAFGANYLTARGDPIKKVISRVRSRADALALIVRGARTLNGIASLIAGRIVSQMVFLSGRWERARFEIALPESMYPLLTTRLKALKLQIFEELEYEGITRGDVRLELLFFEGRAIAVTVLPLDGDGGTEPPVDLGPVDDRQRVGDLVVGEGQERVPLYLGDRVYVGRSAARASAEASPLRSPAIRNEYLTITDDPRVGGWHLFVDASAAGLVWFEDLGSEHGTLLNDAPTSRQTLTSGDRLLLGATEIVIDLFEKEAGRRVRGGRARVVADDNGAASQPEGSPPTAGADPQKPTSDASHLQSRPQSRRPSARGALARLLRTAPPRASIPALALGVAGGEVVNWRIGDNSVGNMNMQILGASGGGKTRLLMKILRQIPDATNMLILDPKGEYVAAEIAQVVAFNPWTAPMPYNPLATLPESGPRARERTVIELRDAIVQTCGSVLGHRQLGRLAEALDRVVDEGTTSDLHSLLDPELRAGIGDLTGWRLFGEGPPLGTLLDTRSIVNLGDVPGDGRMKDLFCAFVLATAGQNLVTWVDAPDAMRSLLVVDEAHRLPKLRALEMIAREGRARGCGVVLCTQLPTDLPRPISAQMATTVCFGLPGSHAATAAEHLGFPELASTIRSLDIGQAVIVQGREDPLIIDTLSPQSERGVPAASL